MSHILHASKLLFESRHTTRRDVFDSRAQRRQLINETQRPRLDHPASKTPFGGLRGQHVGQRVGRSPHHEVGRRAEVRMFRPEGIARRPRKLVVGLAVYLLTSESFTQALHHRFSVPHGVSHVADNLLRAGVVTKHVSQRHAPLGSIEAGRMIGAARELNAPDDLLGRGEAVIRCQVYGPAEHVTTGLVQVNELREVRGVETDSHRARRGIEVVIGDGIGRGNPFTLRVA